jgi:hypothetical protein
MIEMDVKTNSSLYLLSGAVGEVKEAGRGVLHEGAATASDRKSQRRAAANVSCRPLALRKAMGCETCVRCCQASLFRLLFDMSMYLRSSWRSLFGLSYRFFAYVFFLQ